MRDPMERLVAETLAMETSEPPRRQRGLLDRLLRRRSTLSAHTSDPDTVLVALSPGRFTRRRPDESWAEAMNRLTEGHDL